jgi:hypothetical protein
MAVVVVFGCAAAERSRPAPASHVIGAPMSYNKESPKKVMVLRVVVHVQYVGQYNYSRVLVAKSGLKSGGKSGHPTRF